MALLGVIGGVILLCIIAALWATGSATTGSSIFAAETRVWDHREPHPRASGLN